MKTKILFIALGATIILAGAGAYFLNINKAVDIVVQDKIPLVTAVEFEKPVTILVGAEVAYSDGLNVSIKEINDSRCKPDVQCIWAGELAATLVLSGGDLKSTEEIHLGTTNNKSVSSNGYKFTLDSATENSASITVKIIKEPVALISFLKCLPADIKSSDVVEAGITGYENGEPVGQYKVTVEQKLNILKATCNNDKLVDSKGVQITFYHLGGCWGNPPQDYQELRQKQQDEINKLKEKYTVIEMTCNPSGIPIQ